MFDEPSISAYYMMKLEMVVIAFKNVLILNSGDNHKSSQY